MATTNYSWNLPTVGGSESTWGTQLNQNWTALDTLLGGTNATEFAILDGATVTTAELNILDGVTATAAELNILDGVTATAAEINLLDGVTWTLTDYNTLTATAAELNTLDGITGIASQAEAEAGTSTATLMTPERTKQAIEALSPGWEFTSSSTTISRPQTTIAHGLSAVPSRFFVTMKCITATGEFAVGDEIPINSYSFQAGSAPEKFGFNWYADDTYIYISVGSSGVRYVTSNGDYSSYDFSKFNYIARASL